MKYPIINSFNNIPIQQNTLLLCDIDETLLTNKSVSLVPNQNNKPTIKLNLPKYTDKNGFINLLQKLHETNSQIYFITSRNIKYFEFTRRQFKVLGLNIENFPVYFCGDNPKGLIIKQIENINNFDNIIFVDDLKYNLKNVKHELGDRVKCFLFQRV